MSYLKIKKTNLKKEKTVSSTKRLVSTARKDASVQQYKTLRPKRRVSTKESAQHEKTLQYSSSIKRRVRTARKVAALEVQTPHASCQGSSAQVNSYQTRRHAATLGRVDSTQTDPMCTARTIRTLHVKFMQKRVSADGLALTKACADPTVRERLARMH